jgi:hypothetical protein
MSGLSVALAMLLQTSATPPSAVPAVASEEPKVCRRIEVTGYVARKEKICKTRAEWRAAEDSGNGRARAIVEYSTGRSISN